MSLPTYGRVIIETTVGELDIELWSKEAPKACRNFLALAMEGATMTAVSSIGAVPLSDGTPSLATVLIIVNEVSYQIFSYKLVTKLEPEEAESHSLEVRPAVHGLYMGTATVIPEPFEDEIHPRLRWAHRGLVGMANNGQKNTNDSQFFITLDRADELHGKHTLFGRCIGDTIFNVMKIGGMELDANDRPLYPPKIKAIRIIENPFEDIIPRITAAEKRAQQLAREKAQQEREEEARKRGAKKNVKLLSFQDDEAVEESSVEFKKKSITRPDLIDDRTQLVVNPEPIVQTSVPSKSHDRPRESADMPVKNSSKRKGTVDLTQIREQHAREQAEEENSRLAQIQRLEKDIRKLNDKRNGEAGSDEERAKKKTKTHSYLEEELAKYEKLRGKKKKDAKKKGKNDGDVLARMNAFRGKLKESLPDEDNEGRDVKEAREGDEVVPTGENEETVREVDDDTDFLSHRLSFPKDDGEETRKAERDYEVIDPRQRSARAREEERQRKKQIKPRDGGRGSRRH